MADIHTNPDGSEGGFVAATAFVAKTAFVGPDAAVCGYARVGPNAKVDGHARIFGNALVGDHALISEYAQVGGDAIVAGNAHVFGAAHVNGFGRVQGNAQVGGKAEVFSGHLKSGYHTSGMYLFSGPQGKLAKTRRRNAFAPARPARGLAGLLGPRPPPSRGPAHTERPAPAMRPGFGGGGRRGQSASKIPGFRILAGKNPYLRGADGLSFSRRQTSSSACGSRENSQAMRHFPRWISGKKACFGSPPRRHSRT